MFWKKLKIKNCNEDWKYVKSLNKGDEQMPIMMFGKTALEIRCALDFYERYSGIPPKYYIETKLFKTCDMLEIFQKIKQMLPIEFEVYLQAENDTDRACAWRTIRFIKRGQIGFAETNISEHHLGLNYFDLFTKVVEPCVKFLNSKIKVDAFGNPINYKENFKMTREEAHKICFQAAVNYEGKEIDGFIKMLEALGLIKFDEPKKEKSLVEQLQDCMVEIHRAGTQGRLSSYGAGCVLSFLLGRGYKIVKDTDA